MKQLSLDLGITFHPPVDVLPPDSYWDEITKQDNVLEQDKLDTSEAQNPTNCVLEQVNIATAPEQLNHVQKLAPEHNHWVEKYSPSNRPGNFYYRYVWRKGGKLHHMHIRGGHVGKPRAIEMKDKVLNAIAQGEHPEKIVRLIRNGRI